MPTCEYCDGTIEPGASNCPHCHAPRDPSRDALPPRAGTQRPFAAPAPAGAPPAPPGPGQAPQGPGLSGVLQSLQSGDVAGVTRGLQDLVSSGHLDAGKLSTDLGMGGRGLDLGAVANALVSGGPQSGSVVSALARQGGGIGELLRGAAGALKSPAGLAVGGAALAVGAVGAGYLIHKARSGGGAPGGGGIGDTLGSLLGAPAGPTAADRAEYTRIAEQLPPAAYAQLREGQTVLARWDVHEWRPGTVGWVDGGQARVTFEGGLERWCDPADIRLPPVPGQAAPPDQAGAAGGSSTGTDAPWSAQPARAALPAIGAAVVAQAGPDEWRPATIVDTDTIGGRVRVRYENGFECWLDLPQVRAAG